MSVHSSWYQSRSISGGFKAADAVSQAMVTWEEGVAESLKSFQQTVQAEMKLLQKNIEEEFTLLAQNMTHKIAENLEINFAKFQRQIREVRNEIE